LSLRFLDSHDAIAAVACGWDAVSLFGVHRGPAPHERLDAWGLIPAQVWGVLRCSIEHFDLRRMPVADASRRNAPPAAAPGEFRSCCCMVDASKHRKQDR
jgi:hypothetical protein